MAHIQALLSRYQLLIHFIDMMKIQNIIKKKS